MSTIKVDKTAYNDWPNCIHITNGIVELVVTTDVGPRILRFAFVGKQNAFFEFPLEKGLTGGDSWRSYGGHRLWTAPQVRFRAGEADNDPVEYFMREDGVTLIGKTLPESRVQKEIRIRMIEGEARAIVSHKITNWNVWPIELAVWAVTVLGNGGKAIWPIKARDTFYCPNYAIACWPWNKYDDERFTIGARYMTLRHDPSLSRWFKVGVPNEAGWAAYWTQGQLFVKKHPHVVGARYTDYASSMEVFCNDEIAELETLGPLLRLEPGESGEHEETWTLFDNVCEPPDEAAIDELILPRAGV